MEGSSSVVNPWRSMWLRPRDTVRHLVQTSPDRLVLVLAGLAGVAQILDRAAGEAAGDTLSLPMILGFALVLGPLFGILSLYIGSALVAWTGRWIGGSAPPHHIRTAMAWAGVPVVAGLVLWIVVIAVLGEEMFTTPMPQTEASLGLALFAILCGIALFVLGVWSLVLLFKSVGEVQGFSAWKAMGNVLLGGLAFILPLAALVAVVVLLAPG